VNSDNPSGADNQQERLDVSTWLDGIPLPLGHYVAGFVEGEGSFNVPIVRERDRLMPFRISLSFNVSQVGPQLPELLRDVFTVGRIRGRQDGVFYFEVTKPKDLNTLVFPFFERFQLRGPKASDLEVFKLITQLVLSQHHLTTPGFMKILELRGPMNRGGKRRRTDEEIIGLMSRESSETIRRAPCLTGKDEDMARASWRHEELHEL
jgi:hypothetical protein